MGGTPHDDEVGLAGFGQKLQLRASLAAAKCEVTANASVEQLFCDVARQLLVVDRIGNHGNGNEQATQ